MLREVLQAVEEAKGPVTLVELGRRLSVDPGVLEGMLDHWARRGRLVVDGNLAVACPGSCAAACSCGSNSSKSSCPFVTRLPRSYSVAQPSDYQTNTG
jgi:hypothetical protein